MSPSVRRSSLVKDIIHGLQGHFARQEAEARVRERLKRLASDTRMYVNLGTTDLTHVRIKRNAKTRVVHISGLNELEIEVTVFNNQTPFDFQEMLLYFGFDTKSPNRVLHGNVVEFDDITFEPRLIRTEQEEILIFQLTFASPSSDRLD
jgi:hypothetical protein